MFTPEDKTKEKETQFSTTGLLTGQWREEDQAKQAMSTQGNLNISLEDLMTPQYGSNDGQQRYVNPDDYNSVYDPNSKLGGSVFGKSPFDYYLDQKDQERQQRQQEEQQKAESDKKEFYLVIGLAALGYLGYRLL